MRIINFGSLNYDHVYNVDHFVQPKETMSSKTYSRYFGGKGLNQSIALVKAGYDVYHAGKVGNDGQDFIDYLKSYKVNTEYLVKDDCVATGHAIIEICEGENRIILHGGANQAISTKQIDDTLANFAEGDVLLIQNEINNMSYLINKASEKGMYIAFNCAPMNAQVFTYPLEKIDLFFVNEIEAAGLVNSEVIEYDSIIEELKKLNKEIVMTVGENGSYYINGDTVYHQEAFRVNVVDTTAAGDTFTGYFLAEKLRSGDIKKALELASKASSMTVQGKGAAQSIPSAIDVKL